MQTITHQLLVDVPTQTLYHYQNEVLTKHYRVSTGYNGVGEQKGSGQTPRGWHIIRAKIGHNQPPNTIFVGRRPKGIYTGESLGEDWILCRILWLSGLEVGKNRLGDCDTMQRYIYIHGCPDNRPMGIPLSKGCIRMRNHELLALFDSVPVGTKVLING